MAKAKKQSVKKIMKKPVKNSVKKAVKAGPKKTAKKIAKKAASKPKAKVTAKKAKPLVKTAKPVLKKVAKMAQKIAISAVAAVVLTKTAKIATAAAKRAVLPHIAPLRNRVLIRPEPRLEKTSGGLFIPESVEDKPLQGEVLAVGQGKRSKKGSLRPLDVQKGDTVLYAAFAGTDVQLEGEHFLILTEDEILGVIN